MNEIPHGTSSGYQRHRCRCEACRAVSRNAQKASKQRAQARLARDPSLASHGREHTYSYWGCRCPLCTAANTAGTRDRKRRRKAQA